MGVAAYSVSLSCSCTKQGSGSQHKSVAMRGVPTSESVVMALTKMYTCNRIIEASVTL
jgi:hypothetical protein